MAEKKEPKQELDLAERATGFSPATIEVTRKTIFPKGNDEQVALYLYKCVAAGVHPLSGMIRPTVFNTEHGPQVVFISTIDYFRATAEKGDYDGQDEPEYEGLLKIDTPDGELDVPELARVNVYRKNIGRPFVGVARWMEFYPANPKNRMMWHKMPKQMLAKCAEAQGHRRAWPEKLGQLYAQEEMHQATMENLTASKKPTVTQPRVTGSGSGPAPRQASGGSATPPSDRERKQNGWITAKQETRLFVLVSKGKTPLDDFRLWLSVKKERNESWEIRFGDEYEEICGYIQSHPAKFSEWAKKYRAEQEKKPADQEGIGGTSDRDRQIADIRALAMKAGYDRDDSFAAVLKARFGIESPEGLKTVNDAAISKIIDHFLNEAEK